MYQTKGKSRIDVTNFPQYNVSFIDSDDNGTEDRIEWIVPGLSKQTFEVEASITIINVQSYPTLYGNWTVKFNTTGIANLTITPVNDTTFGTEPPDDLEFLELRCRNTTLSPDFDGERIFYPDYSCDENGYEISRVLTRGKHTLEFRFGSDVEYAYNQVPLQIEFIPPTPYNEETRSKNYAYINVSVEDDGDTSSFIDWNRSLVGYWAMDWYDSTGIFDNSTYGNDGTFEGGLGSSNIIDGKYGKGLDFDGADDDVYIPWVKGGPLDITGTNITVEAWVKPDVIDWDHIVDNYNSYYIDLLDSSTGCPNSPNGCFRFGFTTTDPLGHETLDGDIPIPTDEFSHVVGVLNTTHALLYVNGVLDNYYGPETYPSGTGNLVSNDNTYILLGEFSGGPGYNFDGIIDEVRIWNRALSPEEINASYNSGLYRLYHNFTDLEDGYYEYYAFAIDTAGNWNQSETRYLTVNTGKLKVNLSTPSPSICTESSPCKWDQSQTYWVNASVTCKDGNCGYVNGTARYNVSDPGWSPISMTKGATPFYILPHPILLPRTPENKAYKINSGTSADPDSAITEFTDVEYNYVNTRNNGRGNASAPISGYTCTGTVSGCSWPECTPGCCQPVDGCLDASCTGLTESQCIVCAARGCSWTFVGYNTAYAHLRFTFNLTEYGIKASDIKNITYQYEGYYDKSGTEIYSSYLSFKNSTGWFKDQDITLTEDTYTKSFTTGFSELINSDGLFEFAATGNVTTSSEPANITVYADYIELAVTLEKSEENNPASIMRPSKSRKHLYNKMVNQCNGKLWFRLEDRC